MRNVSRPIRILIVEDHRLESDLLRRVIQRQPELEVIGEAADREQAVALTSREQPDITLLDLHLKDKISLDFLPELLATGKGQVIVFTGYDDPDTHRHALESGAAEVVQKACECDVLFEIIRRVHSRAELS